MNLPCAVTRDLLPLYAEDLVEQETEELIAQHLTDCPACRKKLSELKTGTGTPVETAKPLKSLKQQIRKRRWYAALIAALCVFVGVYAYFYRAVSMKIVPWQEGLIEVVRVEKVNHAEEGSAGEVSPEADEAVPMPTSAPVDKPYAGEMLVLNVRSFINGFQEQTILEDDGTTTVIMQGISTNQDPRQQVRSYYEMTYYPVPDRLIYGYEQPQILLWGAPQNGGAEVLPRLALAYYLIIAAACAVLFGLSWGIFRKWRYSGVLRQLFFTPVAYILSHLLLKGVSTTSFFMERDFISILLVAAALYVLLSLAYQMFLLRRRAE